jgi:hypothetical protein
MLPGIHALIHDKGDGVNRRLLLKLFKQTPVATGGSLSAA